MWNMIKGIIVMIICYVIMLYGLWILILYSYLVIIEDCYVIYKWYINECVIVVVFIFLFIFEKNRWERNC